LLEATEGVTSLDREIHVWALLVPLAVQRGPSDQELVDRAGDKRRALCCTADSEDIVVLRPALTFADTRPRSAG